MSFSVPGTRVADRISPTRMSSFLNSSIEIVLTVCSPPGAASVSAALDRPRRTAAATFDPRLHRRYHFPCDLLQCAILARRRPPRGHLSSELPSKLRQRAVEQIPIVVSEVGVETMEEGGLIEIPVGAERNLAEQKIAQRIHRYPDLRAGLRGDLTAQRGRINDHPE